MTERFLEEFLKESTEQITTLNNALLTLESDPDNEAAMEGIFRTAHTHSRATSRRWASRRRVISHTQSKTF